MNRLIILDRDGVINQDSLEYIKSPAEWVPLPGSIDAIARLHKQGFKIAIATNQSGIARGLYSEETLQQIHDKLQSLVRACGGKIDCIQYCPHMPDAGCACRKPKPGMLHAIAKQLGCSLEHAIMVGDRHTDVLVAMHVGVKPMVVLSGMTDKKQIQSIQKVPIFTSLQSCVDEILQAEILETL